MNLTTFLGLLTLGLFSAHPALAETPDLEGITKNLESMKKDIQQSLRRLKDVDVAEVRGWIKVFKTSGESKEKTLAANHLALTQWKISENKNNRSGLTSAELYAVREGNLYAERLKKKADAFETHLTPKEVADITQDNPDSIYRAVGKLYLLSRPTCTPKAFNALKEKLGAEELAGRGIAVMILSGFYEEDSVLKYLARLQALLATPAYAKEGSVLSHYYAAAFDNYTPGPRTQRDQQSERLVRAGVPLADQKAYVTKTAALSPACLLGLNIPFVKQHRAEVTAERGKYFAGLLVAHIRKTGERPSDFRKLPTREGHPIYGETGDEYGNDYVITYAGNQVQVKSKGRDDDKDDDDIVIGTYDLR